MVNDEEIHVEIEQVYAKILEIEEQLKQRGVNDA